MDYSSIIQQLKSLPADRKINETSALQHVQSLKSGILQTTDLTAVLLLTKVLDYTPKSDAIFQEFDAKLMVKLLEIALREDMTEDVIRSILRIWLTYLAGVIPVTRSRGMFNPLLQTISQMGNDKLFKMLTKRITLSDSRMNLNIVDFVSKVLFRITESINSHSSPSNTFSDDEEWLVEVLKSLYISDFFGTLSSFKGVDEIKKMTGLPGSLKMVEEWINGKTVSKESSKYWLECVKLSSEVGIKLDCSTDSSLLPVLVIIGVLSNPKKALFKTLVECSLAEPFPLLSFVNHLAAELAERSMPIFSIWNTSLWYSLLNVASRSWLYSGACLEEGDETSIEKLLSVMIDWLIDQLKGCDSNENIPLLLDDVANFKYEDLRRIQLNKIHERNITKLGVERTNGFQGMIHDEVVSFVKNGRFLELSKGSWVYAENPLDINGSHYTGTWYFITLTSNTKSIIYKKFSRRYGSSKYPGIATVTTSPNIDRDSIKLDLKKVESVTSEDLSSGGENNQTELITMISKRMLVNRINILSEKGSITFYVNTLQLKEIWDDGLNMLLPKGDVGEHILEQMDQLESIATRTQFLSLESEQTAGSQFEEPDLPPLTNFNFNFH